MRFALLVPMCAVALASCGGGGDDERPAADRAAEGDTRVIRGWVAALRDGDVERAAGFFALPSRVQNGTPVVTLRSRRDAILFNEALPCGAVLTEARPHAGFVITRVRLTRRPGADCGTGVGGSARNAIRVRGGKIVEWYRLPDEPRAPLPPDPGPAPDPDPDLPLI